MTDCVFCKIARREIPAPLVAESELAVAFRDLNPQAPTHVLVVPRDHVTSASHAGADAAGAAILGEVLRLGVQVAHDLGLAEAGYRFVMNTGRDGGQSVFHLHLHVLGGRAMGWPPG